MRPDASHSHSITTLIIYINLSISEATFNLASVYVNRHGHSIGANVNVLTTDMVMDKLYIYEGCQKVCACSSVESIEDKFERL
jgi:hypothetical protein